MITFLEIAMLGLIVFLVERLPFTNSESIGSMTGPPKHRGFFYKQTGRNKTIPVSESPGEEMIVFDVGKHYIVQRSLTIH